MSNMKRVVELPDGSIAVYTPAPKSKRPGETESEWLVRVFGKMDQEKGYENFTHHDIDDSDMPHNREFRASWVWDSSSNKVKEDSTKKQTIVDARNKKINDKTSGKNKLKGLGLTDDEIDSI